ncbi:hypothetical protein ACS0TY_004058 [Phlomoides rotata]
MGSWVDDRWFWSWRWRRPLFDRGINSFNVLTSLVDMFHIKNGVEDTWRWRLSTERKFSTKETYSHLLNQRRSFQLDEDRRKGFKKCYGKTLHHQKSSLMHGSFFGIDYRQDQIFADVVFLQLMMSFDVYFAATRKKPVNMSSLNAQLTTIFGRSVLTGSKLQ